MFQTLAAGWVNGSVREALAERVFEPLYQTQESHCSKEGFTFHLPTAPVGFGLPADWLQNIRKPRRMAASNKYTPWENIMISHTLVMG